MSRLQDWIEEQQHFIGLFSTFSRSLEHMTTQDRADYPELADTIVKKMHECLLMIDGQRSHLALLEFIEIPEYKAPLGLQGVMENVARSLADFLTDNQDLEGLQLVSMQGKGNSLEVTVSSGRSFIISIEWAKKLARVGVTDLARTFTHVVQNHLAKSGDALDFSFDSTGYNAFTFKVKDENDKFRKLSVTVVEEV